MYDLSVKYRAIVHYEKFNKSIRKVSKMYNIGKSTLHRWLNEKGISKRKTRTKKQIGKDIQKCIDNAIHSNPFCTLKELVIKIASECSLKLSVSTASRVLKKCRYSFKNSRKIVDCHYDTKRIL